MKKILVLIVSIVIIVVCFSFKDSFIGQKPIKKSTNFPINKFDLCDTLLFDLYKINIVVIYYEEKIFNINVKNEFIPHRLWTKKDKADIKLYRKDIIFYKKLYHNIAIEYNDVIKNYHCALCNCNIQYLKVETELKSSDFQIDKE